MKSSDHKIGAFSLSKKVVVEADALHRPFVKCYEFPKFIRNTGAYCGGDVGIAPYIFGLTGLSTR